MSNRLYACIYIHRFLVTMARRLNPALAGAPVIISGNPKQHGQVIELSPEALALGLCTGMATTTNATRIIKGRADNIPNPM